MELWAMPSTHPFLWPRLKDDSCPGVTCQDHPLSSLVPTSSSSSHVTGGKHASPPSELPALSARNYDPTWKISLICLMKLHLILSPSTPSNTALSSGHSWSSWERPTMPREGPRAPGPSAAHRAGASMHWGLRGFWPSPFGRKCWGLARRQQDWLVLKSPHSL